MTDPKTYRDMGATGPHADEPIWKDNGEDFARIRQALVQHPDLPGPLAQALDVFVHGMSLQASRDSHYQFTPDVPATIAYVLRDLLTQLERSRPA